MEGKMEFSVQVLSDGETVSGKKVSVHFGGSWTGSHTNEYTDDDGLAVFNFDEDWTSRHITIYVNGEEVATHYVDDGDGFTVNI